MAQDEQDSFIMYQEDKDSRWAKFLSNGVSDVLDKSRLVQYILSIYKEEGTDSTVH